jgi:Flp pilus assembly protein TadD
VQLWYYRGSAFNTAGELRSAEKAFLKVLELEPQSAKAIAALAAIVKDDPKSTVSGLARNAL